jgi:hypothetical protein
MLFLEGTKKSSNAVCFKPIANKVAFTSLTSLQHITRTTSVKAVTTAAEAVLVPCLTSF